LSTSTLVDKWEREVTPKKEKLRTIKIKIYPTKIQKKLIDELFDVTRYIYNKANKLVKEKKFRWKPFYPLRDYLVTKKSRKGLTTPRKNFELVASDSTRQCAVKNLCDAYKTASGNLKAGNIRYFDISYKKKNASRQCLELGSRDLNMTPGGFKIYPGRWEENSILKISKKNQIKYGKYQVKNNCDLLRQKGLYYIAFVLPQITHENKIFKRACGVDLGVRTLASSYGTNGIVEYDGNMNLLKKFNSKFDLLKNLKKVRKKALNKIEKKKIDFTDNLHWSLIKALLDENDVVFMGDIKSHNMTKNGKNKTLNRAFNDLKFYVFKERLVYKAESRGKKVFMIPEPYTSQCCSRCGNLWRTIGSSKIYNCKKCKLVCDRDTNSAKNIFMKGVINNL
jgi:IS605 OrfB family transposase